MSNSITTEALDTTIDVVGDIEAPAEADATKTPTQTKRCIKNNKTRKILVCVILGLLFAGMATFLVYSAIRLAWLEEALYVETHKIIDGFAEAPEDGFVIRKGVLTLAEVKLMRDAHLDKNGDPLVEWDAPDARPIRNAAMAKVLKTNPEIRRKLEAVAKEIFPDVSLDWLNKIKEGKAPNDKRPEDGEKDNRDCTDFANILTKVGPNGRATTTAGKKAEKRGWHADFHPAHPLYQNWTVVGLNIGLTGLEDYTGMPFELKNPHTNQRHRVRLGAGDVAAFRPDIFHRVNHDLQKSGIRHNLVADAFVRKRMAPLDYHVDARPTKTLDWDNGQLKAALGW